MSCLTDRLSNIDTTIYSVPGAPDEVIAPQRQPVPVVNPVAQSIMPSCNNNAGFANDAPTADYALFTNAQAPGETYSEGTNISFPTTVYNTDERNIERNNGSVMLGGGRNGRTYMVMYQVSGTFTDAQLVVTENGVAQQASAVSVTGDTTASGNYIVRVPACSETNVSVNVAAGSVETTAPTSGNNLTVLRIA